MLNALPHNRLTSLDAFRGFTIAAMMLVNNPGDWSHLYSQLAHAKWNGWTFTDWVFPFFLFISGMSMAFSLGRLTMAGADKPALLRKLAVRAGIVFLIGFALNLIPHFNFDTVRIPGVLQRIALCTLLAGPIVVYCSWRQQIAGIAALYALYSVLMLCVPAPDMQGVVTAGVLEPGRDFGAFVDRWLMNGHLWVQARTWDPEGLVSTLPALCNLLLGCLAGRWINQPLPLPEKTVWLLVAGLACLWVGAMLDVVFMPINKSLWTVSYSVLTTGWALIVFGVFYWLLDAAPADRVRTLAARALQPFVIYGMNALFLFALSGLIVKMLAFIHWPMADGSNPSLGRLLYAPIQALPLAPVNASLLHAVLFNLAMFAVAWFMWRNKWFFKV
jgi:predicted acyltransferase